MDIKYYTILSVVLFSIGFIGILVRRNAIVVFLCVELMLSSVNLLLVAFSKMHHSKQLLSNSNTSAGAEGQIFVFFIMIVAAVEVAVGLSIIIMIYRNTNSIDVNDLKNLKH